METPANIKHRRVHARFIAGVDDGADVGDLPDAVGLQGSVTFRPSISFAVSPDEPDPFFFVKTTLHGILDSEGYLCARNPNGTAGARGVPLFTTDNASLTTKNWTWTATPKLTSPEGNDLPDVVPAFNFSLPAAPGDLDLAQVVKVPASPGVTTEQAFALVATAAAAAAKVDALVARADAGEFKGDPGGWTPAVNAGTTDLNTLFTPGTYKAYGGAATAARNYPVAGLPYFIYVLQQDPTTVQQTAAPVMASGSAGRVEYKRTANAGVWGPWRTFASQRVDNTAGRVIYTWDDTANREQLIYGDTGTRDISALLGEARTAGSVYLQRSGYLVTLAFNDVVFGTLFNMQELPFLPVGFRPKVWTHFSSSPAATGVARGLLFKTDGVMRAYLPATPGYTVQASVSFLTGDAWPTTLPGTAFGTLPNL